MNARMFFAAFAGGVLNFLLGWLIYGILLMDFMANNMTRYDGLMKEMPNIFLIFISNLLMAFLISYIFDRWAGFRTLTKGFTAGLVISFVISVSFDLYFLAAMNLYSIQGVLVDILMGTLIGGIVGGLIGWILGYGGRLSKEGV